MIYFLYIQVSISFQKELKNILLRGKSLLDRKKYGLIGSIIAVLIVGVLFLFPIETEAVVTTYESQYTLPQASKERLLEISEDGQASIVVNDIEHGYAAVVNLTLHEKSGGRYVINPEEPMDTVIILWTNAFSNYYPDLHQQLIGLVTSDKIVYSLGTNNRTYTVYGDLGNILEADLPIDLGFEHLEDVFIVENDEGVLFNQVLFIKR